MTNMSISRLNELLTNTINSIKGTKDEIFEIVNHSRTECKSLEDDLRNVQMKIKEVFSQIENLEELERKSKDNLFIKSKSFDVYSEKDIKDAYELANGIRTQLMLKREEEKHLIEKRTDIEKRLKKSYEVFKRAENINKQISVATEYLMGNSENIANTMDELSKKHYVTLKIIEAQEDEKSRMARDIHDGPAQSLAHVIMKAELCEKLIDKDIEKSKTELSNLKNISRNTLKDVRKIIYDLKPMSLDDLGLIPTLERYIMIFQEDTGIKVNIKPTGNLSDLESAIQINIFRIIQESLSNIRKHSKATMATVTIEKTLTRINFSIIDDGIGFDIEEQKNKNNSISEGFGLVSIRERVELLNGALTISSSHNRGTRISLFIPLNEEV